MTNAEKFEEVFGFEPDTFRCPTYGCDKCPISNVCNNNTKDFHYSDRQKWWYSEYKEK